MVTLSDVASEVGCANSLVSDVLNNRGRKSRVSAEKRQKILDAAKRLGYRPNEIARAVRTGRSNNIGFVTKSLQRGYAHILLEGILDSLVSQNYSLKIINTTPESNANDIADQCIRYQLQGVISYDFDPLHSMLEFKELLKSHGIPLVMAGGDSPMKDLICIKSDLIQGGHIACEHLYEQGYRRFATIFAYADEPHFKQLFTGFSDAAREKGIELDPRLQFTAADGAAKADFKLLKELHADAVFCNSDFHALNFLTQCLKRGIRVPEDIAILGRGNLSFDANCEPSLSSIDEDLYGMGNRAGNLLARLIANPEMEPFSEYFPHQLIVRDSTANHSRRTMNSNTNQSKRKAFNHEESQQ